MKAKETSFAQKRETALRGFKRYQISFPPPGCREVDQCLEFDLLSLVPWIPQRYHLEPGEGELLDHNGLYRALNLEVVQGYIRIFNERLDACLDEGAFFFTHQPMLQSILQCHREAIGLWHSHSTLYQASFRTLQDNSEKNRKTIQELLTQLEKRKREVARLQRCMARIAGRKTEPIISILKTSGEAPVVVFGASLLDAKRDIESLENHCKLQQIAIADARLLLHLVERGFNPDTGENTADVPGD